MNGSYVQDADMAEGTLLRRPQQEHPAASVADYCSAVDKARMRAMIAA